SDQLIGVIQKNDHEELIVDLLWPHKDIRTVIVAYLLRQPLLTISNRDGETPSSIWATTGSVSSSIFPAVDGGASNRRFRPVNLKIHFRSVAGRSKIDGDFSSSN
ncbi:hypothetical protein ACLOJK_004197, partial [Asimina triloba]